MQIKCVCEKYDGYIPKLKMCEEERIPCLEQTENDSEKQNTDGASQNQDVKELVTEGDVEAIDEVPNDAVSSDGSKVGDESSDDHSSGEDDKECKKEKRKRNKVCFCKPNVEKI